VEKIPDILVRGGFRYSPFLGRDLRAVGMKGFFDVGIEVPLFDRNQGAIAAARAEVAEAEREVDRVRLSLRSRLAAVYQEYQASAQIVERYKTAMLPKARQAHEMYLGNFRNMAAAYPQVLIAQRNLFQLQHDYVQELIQVWRSAVEIQGMLLTGGLDDPGNLQQDGRMGAPGSSAEPAGVHELRAR
jgi:cobalt-zinc-cadmium efflux system outer membrane protein